MVFSLYNPGQDITPLCFISSFLSGGRARACPGIAGLVLMNDCLLGLLFFQSLGFPFVYVTQV